MENHDELRAAVTFFAGQHKAAAVITLLAPGLRFFHQGQFDGRLKRISPHLGRAPNEAVNPAVRAFYKTCSMFCVSQRFGRDNGSCWNVFLHGRVMDHPTLSLPLPGSILLARRC